MFDSDSYNMQNIEAQSAILKAMAHPTRLFIIQQLCSESRCVCYFVEEINADFSTISKHLSVLKNAGLIKHKKCGKKVFYSLKLNCVKAFLECLKDVVENK